MIVSWQHKGLKAFFEKGAMGGIQSKHKIRLKIILQLLDAAKRAQDMDLPGMNFHKLKGNYKNYFSVKVSGNWRIIYKFEDSDASLVDYIDYH